MPRSTIRQFETGTVGQVGWENLVSQLNTFFAAATMQFIDLWIEQRASTRSGLDRLVAYLLYQDLSDNPSATAPNYAARLNDTNDMEQWFADTSDANSATDAIIFLTAADVLPQSDTQKGQQYFYIYADKATSPKTLGSPGVAYIGEANANIAAGASGGMDLLSSDCAVDNLFTVTVNNLSAVNQIPLGERTYVVTDPVTGEFMALPWCCP